AVAAAPRRPDVCTGSAASNDPVRPACTRVAHSARGARLPRSLPLSAPQASDVFSEQVLERRVVQHRLRQQPLKPPVLVLQRLQTTGFRDLEPAVLRFPLVECCAGDPVPPANLFGPGTRLVLAQHPDDLFLAEATPFHCPSPFSVDGLYLKLAEFSGGRPPALTRRWLSATRTALILPS